MALETKEQAPKVEAVLFDKEKFDKEEVKNKIIKFLREGGIKEDDQNFSNEIIEKWFDKEKSILVILQENKKLIGYAVALDDGFLGDDFKSDFDKNKNQISGVPENPKVLYGYSADIAESHKRQRHYWKAMILRIKEGINKGYNYLVIDATGRGFASKFPEYFADFIVFSEDKSSEEYGEQTFFVIDLNKIKQKGLDNFLQDLEEKLNAK